MSFFKDIKLYQNWQETKKLLLNAKGIVLENSLNQSQIQLLNEFDDYLEYNELGLAFDQLIYLSESIKFPKEVWETMILAATEMKLEAEICKAHLNNE
jgi:hypothetical protein